MCRRSANCESVSISQAWSLVRDDDILFGLEDLPAPDELAGAIREATGRPTRS